MTDNRAFEALRDLANLSHASAKGLPQQARAVTRWSGIGFSLLGKNFITPMGEISEMMEVPDSTRLPGVKNWVIGLANVRGRLLPLFDLAQFFGGTIGSGQKKQRRVIVFEKNGLYSGLVVDKVTGMQHFVADTFSAEHGAELNKNVLPFLSGSYRDDDGNYWSVFDMNKLSGEPSFVNAASV